MTDSSSRITRRAMPVLGPDGTVVSYYVRCPACDADGGPFAHDFVLRNNGRGWTFNGNLERPTFSPSMLSRDKHRVCHSFVTDGRIQYLDDCTHVMRGQTVELPDVDEG